MSDFDLSVRFFLQLAVILVTCRLVGLLARRIGQPQVVSEMVAGVLLGPSLFGLIAPEMQAYLFPPESKTILFTTAQVGLTLYMFLVGLEFEIGLIRRRFQSAVSVSLAGIVAPFTLGAGTALLLLGDPAFFAPSVGRFEAMLFLGASMSITAFPMLARIIHERGLGGTSLGTLALAAGSIDDAAAWCLLAVALAAFSGDPMFAAIAIVGGAVYALGLLSVGRRWLALLGRRVEREGTLSDTLLTAVLVLVMLGAWFTDAIRIYAVFGAFVMGVAMPRGRFSEELVRRIGPFTTVFLLPIFFVYSGLNTRIGLLDQLELWVIALAVLAIATLGKGVACWLAARWSGEPNTQAMAIGTLMNARGLMELILLNIGLERGIIQPTLFTILVLMAIATTLMATPLFERVYVRPATEVHTRASGLSRPSSF